MKWPDHPYAENALFWRGECYFAKGDYLRASEQFEGVATRFPAGNKAPDALLQLGVCRQKLGDPTAAKEAFDRSIGRIDGGRDLKAVNAGRGLLLSRLIHEPNEAVPSSNLTESLPS